MATEFKQIFSSSCRPWTRRSMNGWRRSTFFEESSKKQLIKRRTSSAVRWYPISKKNFSSEALCKIWVCSWQIKRIYERLDKPFSLLVLFMKIGRAATVKNTVWLAENGKVVAVKVWTVVGHNLFRHFKVWGDSEDSVLRRLNSSSSQWNCSRIFRVSVHVEKPSLSEDQTSKFYLQCLPLTRRKLSWMKFAIRWIY